MKEDRQEENARKMFLAIACLALGFSVGGLLGTCAGYRTAETRTADAQTHEAVPGRGLGRETDNAPENRFKIDDSDNITRVDIGRVTVSGFCPCAICTEKEKTYACIEYPEAGRTIAADPSRFAMGTVIEIDGTPYVMECMLDGFGDEFAVYFDTHEDVEAYGKRIYRNAYELIEVGGTD